MSESSTQKLACCVCACMCVCFKRESYEKGISCHLLFFVSPPWITCAAVIRNIENTEFEVPSSEDTGWSVSDIEHQSVDFSLLRSLAFTQIQLKKLSYTLRVLVLVFN